MQSFLSDFMFILPKFPSLLANVISRSRILIKICVPLLLMNYHITLSPQNDAYSAKQKMYFVRKRRGVFISEARVVKKPYEFVI